MSDFVNIGDGSNQNDYVDLDYLAPYLFDGECPICGGYMRTIGGNYADDPMRDECEDCSYTTDIDYQ
jgi:hypothetical protein